MKKSILLVLITMMSVCVAMAQVATAKGRCSSDVSWSFDGQTLTINKSTDKMSVVRIPNYDLQTNLAPWVKRKLPVKKVKIGEGIERVGSCAFANCKELQTVEFADKSLKEIGWGVFYNCSRLFSFSIPVNIQKIETIAFANCSSLRSVKIPSRANVEDYAFLSCTRLDVIEIAPTAIIGRAVFATEIQEGGGISHKYYNGEIRSLPTNITVANCQEYGLAKETVANTIGNRGMSIDENKATSMVDTIIPDGNTTRNDTYALIIGNQHYRFVPDVPYANHDARIFAEYCKKTLGIPAENIHLSENATKHMIMEEEIGDWLANDIDDRSTKNIIVYYAGHGVPDIRNQNKAYILPTDVYGTKPQHGIALDDFYSALGDLAFNRVTVFLDACFSGINRNDEAVNEGLRAVEIEAKEGNLSSGNIIVFSAAQGNETAQGYLQEGHGLFTYYLLEELQKTNGNLSYGQLAERLQDNVSRKAPQLNLRKKQTPSTMASDAIADSWKRVSF